MSYPHTKQQPILLSHLRFYLNVFVEMLGHVICKCLGILVKYWDKLKHKFITLFQSNNTWTYACLG